MLHRWKLLRVLGGIGNWYLPNWVCSCIYLSCHNRIFDVLSIHSRLPTPFLFFLCYWRKTITIHSMDVQQERISQILATVKCSDCGVPVEFRKLSSHICKAAPAVPNLPATFKNNMGSSTGLNPGRFNGIKSFVDRRQSHYIPYQTVR